EKIRLEAASYKGKVVYFQVIGPWTRLGSNPFIRSEMSDFEFSTFVAFVMLLVISLWIAAVLLAVRNWRLGRGDRAGAARLFLIVFLLSFGSYLLWAHHIAAPQELGVIMLGAAFGLLQAGFQWLYYMAVEPLVRRLWPHALITWSRLLAGRLRDPLVGRDLLIGTSVGMLLGVLVQLRFVAPAWFGVPAHGPFSPRGGAFV